MHDPLEANNIKIIFFFGVSNHFSVFGYFSALRIFFEWDTNFSDPESQRDYIQGMPSRVQGNFPFVT